MTTVSERAAPPHAPPPPSDPPPPDPPPARGGRTALHAFAALVLGLLLGIGAAASGSALALRLVALVEPVGTLWINAVRMTVIPLIVSSLVVAVAGAAPRTVGRLGARAFALFLLILSATAALTMLVAPPLFDRLAIDPAAAASIRAAAGAVERPELPSFASWLVGLVPTNPIGAAADGAMLPLLVFTLAFGLALARLDGAMREPVVGFFRGVAAAMTTLVGWILLVAPIGVFALALALAVRLGTGVVGAVGFYLAAHAAILLLALALLYVLVAVAAPMRLGTFARALLPPQVVAVTTRSSLAALPAMLTSARAAGLPAPMASFVLPLSVSTFRLNQAVTWVVMALFAAKLYGVELPAAELATLAVTSVLMSFSVPGIPSGSLFMIAPFFAAAGIPPESVGVLIALDLVPDVFKTLLNVTASFSVAALLGRTAVDATEDRGAGGS